MVSQQSTPYRLRPVYHTLPPSTAEGRDLWIVNHRVPAAGYDEVMTTHTIASHSVRISDRAYRALMTKAKKERRTLSATIDVLLGV